MYVHEDPPFSMWKAIITVIAFFVVLFFLSIGLRWCQTAEKVAELPNELIEKTFESDNVIYNYEWFKKQNEEVKAQREKIAISAESVRRFAQDDMQGVPRAKWATNDKVEYDTRTAILDGLKKTCLSAAADYNAKAKMANRNIFMQGVPSQVSCD